MFLLLKCYLHLGLFLSITVLFFVAFLYSIFPVSFGFHFSKKSLFTRKMETDSKRHSCFHIVKIPNLAHHTVNKMIRCHNPQHSLHNPMAHKKNKNNMSTIIACQALSELYFTILSRILLGFLCYWHSYFINTCLGLIYRSSISPNFPFKS